jgi:peptidoglycan/LPS O-acetylase OafA/YrhL
MSLDPVDRHALRLKYRPDVDGLRAVAVLLVFADHLVFHFSGGYVGVDVFFVISGYLITSTILPEVMENRFSLVAFYERRVRRIFPAMLAMLGVTTALAYQFLVPNELQAYSRSLLSTLFSSSNFLFWHEAGYFDLASSSKPLLHTWSLAVEEQFYLLFPLFLVGVRRHFPERMRTVVAIIALASFVASAVTVPGHTPAAFFFAPLRAWELLLGAMLTIGCFPAIKSKRAREISSVAGMLMILLPARFFDSTTLFPGISALLPCLGATLVIASGEFGSSAIGRVLSWGPFVWIGLISYSLYLWHWPIIVFGRVAFFLHPGSHGDDLRSTAILASLSFAVAILSWAFVEQPFRSRRSRFRPGRARLFAINGAALLVLAIAGGLLSHGAPSRFSPEEQQYAAYDGLDENGPFRGGKCFIGPDFTVNDYDRALCLERHPGRRAIALLGDSHAAALWLGMSQEYADHDVLQVTISGCRPLLNQPPRTRGDCAELYDYFFKDYLLNHPVQSLVLVGRWQTWDIEGLGSTIAYLKGHNIPVTLVGPMIEYDAPLPRLIVDGLQKGHPERTAQHRTLAPEMMDRYMSELATTRWEVPYVSVYKDLCKPLCPVSAGVGVPLLFDTDHFTAPASMRFADIVRENGEIQ